MYFELGFSNATSVTQKVYMATGALQMHHGVTLGSRWGVGLLCHTECVVGLHFVVDQVADKQGARAGIQL